jgi:hypothetical protein
MLPRIAAALIGFPQCGQFILPPRSPPRFAPSPPHPASERTSLRVRRRRLFLYAQRGS